MIETSGKDYDTTYPYVLECDRLEPLENQTTYNLNLLRPERNNYYVSRFADCAKQQGSRNNKLDHKKFTLVENDRLMDIVDNVENVKIDGTVNKKVDKSGDRALLLKHLTDLDSKKRDELAEAGSDMAAMSEGLKKNLPISHGSPSGEQSTSD